MNKINFKYFFTLFFLILSVPFLICQDLNEYGVPVVDNPEVYYSLVQKDSSKMLVDLEKFIPGIKLDIQYATENNFLRKPVYEIPKAFLRLPAAESLKKIQEALNVKGMGLKIFDAYRPYRVTVIFYEEYEDTTFVASPWRGSRHNRGCAVDLTIIDLESGEELRMPTDYDDFTEKAHVEFENLDAEIINNRQLLLDIMQENGFKVYSHEWWHFDYEGWDKFELLDISFEELLNKD
jgi:zinc D-Ala-D-Ala dipeptidase